MTSYMQRKSSFSTGRSRHGSVPRFSDAIVGGDVSTATHHALSSPRILEYHSGADEPERLIPGAYPRNNDLKKARANWSSLPSHEIPSGSRVGVGSLPGPYDEAGVAILPDERLHDHRDDHLSTLKVDLPTHEIPSGSRAGVGSLPGPNVECGVAVLPDERHPDRVELDNEEGWNELPSSEHPSGSRVGIGSMPGKFTESGVATLPEERIDGRPYGHGHTGFEDYLGNQKVHVDTVPHATAKTESHPKETIFSATQREKARDPTFVASTGAVFDTSVHDYVGNDPDPSESFRAVGANIGANIGHVVHDAAHVASEALENAENMAAGIYHGAEHMLHNVEAYFASGTAERSEPAPSTDQDNIPERNIWAVRHPPGTSAGPDRSLHVVGEPTRLPLNIQNKYYHNSEYDLDGERLDTDQFLYEDDMSTNSSIAPPTRIPRARGDKFQSRTDATEERDIGVGHGGVEYYLDGKDGILPGYPTAEGMQKLLSTRVADDRLRAAGGQNSASPASSIPKADELAQRSHRVNLLRTESGASNEAVRGSELPSGAVSPDPSFDYRIIEEKREKPISSGGGALTDEPQQFDADTWFKGQTRGPAIGSFEVTSKPSVASRYEPVSSGTNSAGFTSKDFASSKGKSFSKPYNHPSKSKKQKSNTYAGQPISAFYGTPALSARIPKFEEKEERPVFVGGETTASGKYEAVFESANAHSQETTETRAPDFRDWESDFAVGGFESAVDPVKSSSTGGFPGYLGKAIDKNEATKVQQAQRLGKRMGLN